MTNQKTRLDSVVNDFISSLPASASQELKTLILNHQVQESWPWYEVVLSRYLEGGHASLLISEIDDLFPDESSLKLIETTSELPIFEAKIILREAQKAVRD